MSSLDQTLKEISGSLQATLDASGKLHSRVDTPEVPVLVEDLLQKTSQQLPEGVSLLDLKNLSMLSYLNNVLLIVMARLEALKTNEITKIQDGKSEAVKRSIIQRVVMERGIKNLEKKLQYQLEKMVRNYSKMENESSEQSVSKKLQTTEDYDSENENNKDSEEEDDEDSEDELNYRPDASSLMKDLKKSDKKKLSSSSSEKTEAYKPPKISAALPPSQFRDSESRPKRNVQKLQAMEEYLAETGDAPMTEHSIGSNILNHGRDGIQTAQARRKEQEIKTYEESNFTRLSTTLSKKDKRDKRRQQEGTFFGEDWGIFNSRGDNKDMNTKRSKPQTAWDRAKKRRT